MRKLYNEFFQIQEGEKIRDKVLFTRIGASIAFVVVLMVAMSFAAYGYFTANVYSGANVITSGTYTVDIQVLDESGADLYAEGPVSLEPGNYDVSMSYVEGSSSTGFGIVSFGDFIYHTHQIGADVAAEGGFRENVSFTLIVEGPDAVSVTFGSSWGTSVMYGSDDQFYIENGDTVTAPGKMVGSMKSRLLP